eukprot:COSAG01_NODE_408_length_17382_cov_6.231431_18_plen_248_part_00
MPDGWRASWRACGHVSGQHAVPIDRRSERRAAPAAARSTAAQQHSSPQTAASRRQPQQQLGRSDGARWRPCSACSQNPRAPCTPPHGTEPLRRLVADLTHLDPSICVRRYDDSAFYLLVLALLCMYLVPATLAFLYWECNRTTYKPGPTDSAARRKANTPSLNRFCTFWFGVYVAAWLLLIFLVSMDDVVTTDAAEFNPFEILGIGVRPPLALLGGGGVRWWEGERRERGRGGEGGLVVVERRARML